MILNRRVVIISVTYITLIVVGILFGIKPLLVGVRTKQANLQTEYDRYRNAQLKLDQLNQLTQYKSDVDNAKTVINTAIPQTLDQDKLILSLEKMVADQNLKLNGLTTASGDAAAATAASATAKTAKPATPAPKPLAATLNKLFSIQVTMDVSGSYADVNNLLVAIEKVDRIMTITSINLTAATGTTTDSINATIALTAFGLSDKL